MTQEELNLQAVVNLRHLADQIERGALIATELTVKVGAFTVAYEEAPAPLPCGHPRSAAVEATDQDDLARGVRSWICRECGHEFESEIEEGGDDDGQEDGQGR